jgi:hypothetical protein
LNLRTFEEEEDTFDDSDDEQPSPARATALPWATMYLFIRYIAKHGRTPQALETIRKRLDLKHLIPGRTTDQLRQLYVNFRKTAISSTGAPKPFKKRKLTPQMSSSLGGVRNKPAMWAKIEKTRKKDWPQILKWLEEIRKRDLLDSSNKKTTTAQERRNLKDAINQRRSQRDQATSTLTAWGEAKMKEGADRGDTWFTSRAVHVTSLMDTHREMLYDLRTIEDDAPHGVKRKERLMDDLEHVQAWIDFSKARLQQHMQNTMSQKETTIDKQQDHYAVSDGDGDMEPSDLDGDVDSE